MKMKRSAPWRIAGTAGALCVALIAVSLAVGRTSLPAWASGFFTNGVCTAGSVGTSTATPAVTYCNNSNTYPLTGAEQIPADTELTGGQTPQSEAVQVRQLTGYVYGQPSRGNAIIGGDFGTNLWQRGTTGSAVTTTLTYDGPDRFAVWSGTGTEMKLIRSSLAADLPAGYSQAMKLQRTSGQTGVVQACVAQEIASANSFQFAGQTAELDFHAATGANFSASATTAVPYAVTAYVITGTGTDQGLAGSNSMAFGLNAGGSGSGAWTSQANATAAQISLGGVSTSGRYAAVAAIPAGTTEIGVVLCYTPTGTAGTNDYIAFDGVQLVRNPALVGAVNATAGYSCTTIQCTGFERRPANLEADLQYSYYWQLNDPAATVRLGSCQVITANTLVRCLVPLPQPMRAAPTITAPGSNTAFAITAADGTANVCTALAVTASATVLPTGPLAVDCTPTSNIAITVPSQLLGDAQAFSIKASAEL